MHKLHFENPVEYKPPIRISNVRLKREPQGIGRADQHHVAEAIT